MDERGVSPGFLVERCALNQLDDLRQKTYLLVDPVQQVEGVFSLSGWIFFMLLIMRPSLPMLALLFFAIRSYKEKTANVNRR